SLSFSALPVIFASSLSVACFSVYNGR
ncbi:hypothetical protein L2W02_12125, partial [Escherichia coli]